MNTPDLDRITSLIATLPTQPPKEKIQLSKSDGTIVELAAEIIGTAPREGKMVHTKGTVEIIAVDKDKHEISARVKISELSSALGISKKEMKREIKAQESTGTLEQWLESQLSGRPVLVPAADSVKEETETYSSVEPSLPEATKSATSPKLISEEAKENAFRNLSSLPRKFVVPGTTVLTVEEYEQIEKYYQDNHADLEKLTEPTHIRKTSVNPPLPRSVVYIPTEPGKGLYVLLKSKGVKEIGLGSFNRATLAFKMDTGDMKICRDGKEEHSLPGEIKANQLAYASGGPVVAGIPVKYKGPWRQRAGREKDIDKTNIPREKEVNKLLLIMDWMEGGELIDSIEEIWTQPELQKVKLALDIARSYGCLHQLGIVHADGKLENVFIDKDGTAKLADFGFSNEVGTIRKGEGICGAPGYLAPELVEAFSKNKDMVYTKEIDIYIMGCIFSLLYGMEWRIATGQVTNNFLKLYNLREDSYNSLLKATFPHYRDSNHLHFIIYNCLQKNPAKRPKIEDVLQKLEEIEADINDLE